MPHAVESSRRFRFRDLSPSDPYYPNWLGLRRRVNGERLALAVMFACLACNMLFEPASGTVGLSCQLSLVLTILVNVYIGIWWSSRTWPCPRCGKPFYVSGRHCGVPLEPRLPECSHCVRCNLPEYAPNGEVDNASR